MRRLFAWFGKKYDEYCAVLREINSDDSKRLSQMRINTFYVLTVILGVFVYKNVQAPAGTIVDFPSNAAFIVLIMIGGKVLQKLIEGGFKLPFGMSVGSVSAQSQSVTTTTESSTRSVEPAQAPVTEEPCPKSY